MFMVPFYTRFPDLAFEEMRTAELNGQDELPDGIFGFLELYCPDPICDCRRVVINVVRPETEDRVWATINFGWESRGFYAEWLGTERDVDECKGPSLDPLNSQSQYSGALLRLFEQIVADPAYVARLQRHYSMFKAANAPANGANVRNRRRKSSSGKRRRRT